MVVMYCEVCAVEIDFDSDYGVGGNDHADWYMCEECK